MLPNFGKWHSVVACPLQPAENHSGGAGAFMGPSTWDDIAQDCSLSHSRMGWREGTWRARLPHRFGHFIAIGKPMPLDFDVVHDTDSW